MLQDKDMSVKQTWKCSDGDLENIGKHLQGPAWVCRISKTHERKTSTQRQMTCSEVYPP